MDHTKNSKRILLTRILYNSKNYINKKEKNPPENGFLKEFILIELKLEIKYMPLLFRKIKGKNQANQRSTILKN